MIAPSEGSAANVTTGQDSEPAQNDRNRARASQVIGIPAPWQVRTLLMLQQRAREAQQDFNAALASFAPEKNCSLVDGQWVRNG